MKEYKKFELENISEDKAYVLGLREIYDQHGYPTGGLVKLLPNQEYPGYCQLFINEIPAYTKDKDYILIKTSKESTSVIFAHDPDSFKLVNGKTESTKNGYLKWEKTFVE